MNLESQLKAHIREVPDFPIPGVNFKDISPVFLRPELIRAIVKGLADPWRDKGITKVLGIESRGFLFGPILAAELNAGFVIARKAGKLPPATKSISYALEYGNATIEVVQDSVNGQDHVLIHDDLLATGGTAVAAAKLAQSLNASVAGFSFLINLSFLQGREALKQISPAAEWLIEY